MKRIQKKLTLILVLSTVLVAVVNGGVGIIMTRRSTNTAIEKTLLETSGVAALAAQNAIATYTATVSEIASNSLLANDSVSLAEKLAFLQERVEAYYMRSAGILDLDGRDMGTRRDMSGEEFYQQALDGNTYMSSPYILDNDAYLVVSAPVMRDGRVHSVIYFTCDTLILQQIIDSNQVGEKGSAYILDKNGTTIAYNDEAAVLAQENVISQAAQSPQDKDLQALAAIEQRMINGETGIGRYSYSDGTSNIQAFAPIASTDGWSIAVTADEGEFMQSARIGNYIQLGIFAVIIAAVSAGSVKIGRSIAKPIVQCSNRLELLAQGDLQSPVPEVRSQDEVHILADSTEKLVDSFRQIVAEIGDVLGKIAGGDLTSADSGTDYPGDFASLKEHLHMINDRLNAAMGGIIDAAEQVSGGSDQVASTSAILSQGATEQASAVDELSATVTDISNTARRTAELAEQAKEAANNAGVHLEASSQDIANLNGAMKHITQSSQEIGKIIDTIENIAFQTNILALNAAVEAARAGTAGKGFAVVADEVRNLASKSDQAAKATKDLIEKSISAVDEGSEVVAKVTDSVAQVMDLAKGAVSKMGVVAEAVAEQTGAISQVQTGIEQISSVVQTNSATSEESAATSQELSHQADVLKSLVNGFTLRRQDAAGFGSAYEGREWAGPAAAFGSESKY